LEFSGGNIIEKKKTKGEGKKERDKVTSHTTGKGRTQERRIAKEEEFHQKKGELIFRKEAQITLRTRKRERAGWKTRLINSFSTGRPRRQGKAGGVDGSRNVGGSESKKTRHLQRGFEREKGRNRVAPERNRHKI